MFIHVCLVINGDTWFKKKHTIPYPHQCGARVNIECGMWVMGQNWHLVIIMTGETIFYLYTNGAKALILKGNGSAQTHMFGHQFIASTDNTPSQHDPACSNTCEAKGRASSINPPVQCLSFCPAQFPPNRLGMSDWHNLTHEIRAFSSRLRS